MLESCYKYIDYWVIQDNGSTDDTKEKITSFFEQETENVILGGPNGRELKKRLTTAKWGFYK